MFADPIPAERRCMVQASRGFYKTDAKRPGAGPSILASQRNTALDLGRVIRPKTEVSQDDTIARVKNLDALEQVGEGSSRTDLGYVQNLEDTRNVGYV